jgi:cysteine/O-acetylserine efflux protein
VQNFYPFILYVFVTTFTPGPNHILAMTHAMRFGYRRSLGFLAGVFCGFWVLMLGCGWLHLALESVLLAVTFWIDLLGAGYMVYLAVHTLLSRPNEDRPNRGDLNSFAAGFGLQFLNPKVILYGITVYSMFIARSFQDPFLVSLFAPLLAGIGFAATSCWALGGTLFRQVWARYFRWFNLVMAGLLIYIAACSLFHIQ